MFLGKAKQCDMSCDTLILSKLNVNLHIVEPQDFCQLQAWPSDSMWYYVSNTNPASNHSWNILSSQHNRILYINDINIWRGCIIFLTISDPRWNQPISDISIFFASGQLIFMHRTHFMQNIWRKWPKRSIFKIRTAVATKTTSPL